MTSAPVLPPGSPEADTQRLTVWRGELVADSGPNTLLWSDRAVALDITHSHPGGLAKLLAGKTTRLSELYREPGARERAVARARAIREKELELDRERGVPGCFLAVGRASWTERRGPAPYAPVFLRRARLVPHDASLTEFDVEVAPDVEFNPVLRSFLSSVGGGDLPFEALARSCLRPSGFDPSGAYAELGRAAAGPPGWTITGDLWITTFPYAKLSAVADAARVVEQAADHPLVGALARGSSTGPHSGEVRAATDPERTTVLDADPSQIAVLEAVRAGRTLVVDSGPGTGKAQTIVNVVADLAASGQRTLVVAASAGTREAIRGRLTHAGLHTLIHEPGTSSSPVALPPPSIRTAQLQSEWTTAGRELREHVARMHDVREPWGVSLHEIQDRIAAVCVTPTPPRSKVRLRNPELAAIGQDQLPEWVAALSEVAARGAWPGPDDAADPWWGASLSSPQEVDRAAAAVSALGESGLSDFDAQVRQLFAGLNIPSLPTLGAYGELIAGMDNITRVLESFRLPIFDAPLDQWTRPGSTGAFERLKHSRAIRSLLRPGASPADTDALLIAALSARPLWQQVRGSQVMPGQVRGIAQAQTAYDTLAEHAGYLGSRLRGTPDLLGEPLPQLQARVAELRAAADRMRVLPAVTGLMAKARAAGFGELIEDLATRRLPPERVAAETEFVWLASVLAEVTAADAGYARVAGDHLRAAGGRFREVDRSLQAGLAAGIATDPRTAGSVWMVSPYAVGLRVPAAEKFDVVVFADAECLSVGSSLSALARAPQALVVGDSRLPGPTAFTATTGGTVAEPRRVSLLDEAATLWPVYRLAWHYRSHDERLIEWVAEHAYAGRFRYFPAPRDTGGLRVEQVAGGDDDQALVERAVHAALAHASARPTETLAIICLNSGLAARVRAALARALEPGAEAGVVSFFGGSGPQPCVVTDAERVSGLVRDAVLVVIGRDAPSDVSGVAGTRLLTAALTRARARLTVLHSVDAPAVTDGGADPLPARNGTDGGSLALGMALLADLLGGTRPTAAADRAPDLLADLTRRLTGRGLRVGVGLAPGVVDLAVTDPFAKSAEGLAVQLDGPACAALGGTRMRDRLVQEQLRRLGWRPLRILSVDLFRDPAREEARIAAALERLASGDSRSGPITRGPGRRAMRAGSATPVIQPAGPAVGARDQTRDDTDVGWGEAPPATKADGPSTHDRWLLENRPPHWD